MTTPAGEAAHGVVVVIPSLHPGADFPMIVRGIVDLGLPHVLVVDDGSGPDYAATFAEIAALPGCTVLTHPVNRGKGAALKTALSHCMAQPAVTGIVTADSDGQHTPADIRRVAERLELAVAEEAGTSVEGRVAVLGVRDFTLPHLPLRSRIGNRLTTGVVRLLFGRAIPDTQTGLRAFPRDLFAEVDRVPGERFEYEMNVLMYLLTRGIRVDEVSIETIYHDLENSQSHFRPVHDSLVIYRGILLQGLAFAASSGIGALIDLLAFAGVIDIVFGGKSFFGAVATATVVARVVSGLTNYTINRWVVFGSDRPRGNSFVRYALLAVALLIASALATTVLSAAFDGHVVWAKIVVDSVLFVVSYLIQRRWVFAPSRNTLD